MAISTNTIRNKLQDTATDNTFLGAEEFSGALITSAMEQAVSYWNSVPPLMDSLKYETASKVPSEYEGMFIQGIIGILLRDQVILLARNRQPVQAEGISTDINRRVELYKPIADQSIDIFYKWILSTKRALASKALRAGS